MKVLLDPTKIGPKAAFLEANLLRRVVGQDEAVRKIVGTYQVYLAGLNAPHRPVGSFLFLGPTGCGKTRTVEALAETLFGDFRAMVKVDCGEFQHRHEISKLVGSPPGYLGHRETHAMLEQEALNRYRTAQCQLSLILFDEIEKASGAVWNLLLGILDKATLTLGNNRRVTFSQSLVFMTSNLGARQIIAPVSNGMGFQQHPSPASSLMEVERASVASIEAARRNFAPEFMNRIDHVVAFSPLTRADLEQVLDIEVETVQQRIIASLRAPSFAFTLSTRARELLLNTGADIRYGARHLKRGIERLLVHPLANLVATHQVRAGDCVAIDHNPPSPALDFVLVSEGPLLSVPVLNGSPLAQPGSHLRLGWTRRFRTAG
jgi:ATP-dependent Clp protease ATP-binding subunit ClpB